ncbi:MAG: MBL fold metallo-hydrolase [Ignavibacteriota bacterium]
MGVILVDDKFAADAPNIVAKVKSVTDKPIRYVLNTHQHGDHTGGNEAMLAANAEIIMHKNARANMVTGKMPGLSHVTFSDESQVFLGGKEVVAKHLGRGHTNGDAVIYFPSEKVLHTGDLFVVGAPYCDANNGGSIKEWDRTVQKVLDQYPFEIVIPGHGPVSKREDLVKWVGTMAAIREHVKKACAAGDKAADVLEFSGLAFQPSTLFKSGMPGMCKELAQ